MVPYKKYLIKADDQFNPNYFTFVANDVLDILSSIAHIKPAFKPEIIYNALRGQPLKAEWITINPELAQLVAAKNLPSQNIESLFESCRNNAVFTQQLENYLETKLTLKRVSL